MENAASPNHFDWSLGFEREPNRLAYAYWTSRSEGRSMPRRADLDPAAMRKFTPHVGLVEIRPGEADCMDYFIRRAGSRWEDVYGQMTGKLLREFLPAYIEQSWRDAFDAVREAKAPMRLTARVDFQEKKWLQIEMLIAPLGEDDQVSMLFTSFVSWTKGL